MKSTLTDREAGNHTRRPPLFFKRGYPLRITIGFVFTLLIFLSGITLIGFNYFGNQRTTILAARNLLGQDTFVRRADRAGYFEGHEPEQINVGLFELIDAFRQLMADMGPDRGVEITADTISVKDRISQLVDLLEEKQSLTFEEMFGEKLARGDLVVTFLAILEMVKLGLLRITQHVQTGIIRVFYQ